MGSTVYGGRRRVVVAALAFGAAATAIAAETVEAGAGAASVPAAGATITVPTDVATIQEAVDAASPGDLVLIEPGVYHEAVDVLVDELTIRGLERNTTILDGEFELDNGFRVFADGVAIENITAQNYTANGFFWTGVTGYRGSYLTAYRIGDYGIYAFDSTNGVFEHSWAAGSPDAGFYIGQCFPCDAVIHDVESLHNGLGYSGTNSGGNLLIVNSSFHHNRAGIVPNSGTYELCYPSRETTIAGNLVYSNNQPDTPAIDTALLAMGNGILLAGAYDATVMRNRVWDHDVTGIAAVPFPEENPLDEIPTGDELALSCAEHREQPVSSEPGDLALWDAHGNTVTDNAVSDSGLADLAVGSTTDPSTLGNCFGGNEFAESAPADIEALAPCDGDGGGDWTVNPLDLGALIAAEHPPSVDYEEAELPEIPELDNLPDAATASPAPAVDLPGAWVDVDLGALDAVDVPDAPDDPAGAVGSEAPES